MDWENGGIRGYIGLGLETKLTPDHMTFEGVFEVLISITDFRYLEQNGARYGPGLALFGEIVLPG